MRLSRKTQIVLSVVVVLGLGFAWLVEFTPMCRLEAVTLDGMDVDDWPDRFGLHPQKPVVSQPLDSLAQTLMARKGVFRVDIAPSLSGRLAVRINDIEPACLLLDRGTGNLYGLNRDARVISLERRHIDWERPVITGAEGAGVFERCFDARVSVIVDNLEWERENHPDLYRLIEQIDVYSQEAVAVSLAGFPFTIKVRAARLASDLDRFIEFVAGFDVNLDSVRVVDMRFDDLIICGKDHRRGR